MFYVPDTGIPHFYVRYIEVYIWEIEQTKSKIDYICPNFPCAPPLGPSAYHFHGIPKDTSDGGEKCDVNGALLLVGQ